GALMSAMAGTRTVLMLPSAGVLGTSAIVAHSSVVVSSPADAATLRARAGASLRWCLGRRGYRAGGDASSFTRRTRPRSRRTESPGAANSGTVVGAFGRARLAATP